MTPLTPGQTFTEGFALPLRIIAIADGHILARFKDCMPFVESAEKFEKRLEIAKILSPKIK